MRYLIILRGCPGCVDDKTEFFNGTQWVPISQYSTGMKVLQYNKDGTAELVLPNGFIKYSCEDFVKLTNKTNSVNQVLTLDHNVAYLSSKGNLNKCTARELLSRYQNNVSGFPGKFIHTFKFVGQTYDIDDNLLRLYIAVSADGSLTKNGFWRIRLYKDYKIKRLEFLLNTLDIPIDKRVYTDGSTNFYIPKKYGVKVFPKEFYFLNEHQRKIFKEEIFNWDGCLKTQTYRTTIKANADLVQFILSQFDYLTSISIDDRRGKMYTHSNKKYLRKSICYAVHLTNTKQTAIRKRHRTSDPTVEKIKLANSYAYCFSVPSGLLVLRRANTIFITGNSGKSSWADAKFEPYVLSTDKIRLLLQSPITDIFGSPVISQKNNKEMGRILMEVLETRMSRGEFIVLDATHAKPNSWRKYDSLIQKYQYRVAVLEFADEPLEEYLQRNENREPYKKVPPEVIVNMYNDITNNRAKSNSRYKVYTEDNLDFWNDWSADLTPEDYSEYKSIVIFGDIHGCYTPLKSYFESHPFSDETLYIFTGDYLDRGLENYEVMKYMLSIYDKPNVICLEGNHECWLRHYSSKNPDDYNNISSAEFLEKTVPQLEDIFKEPLDKTEIRKFCRKLHQLAYFCYHDSLVVVTHAGVPCIPTKLTPTRELIKGTGSYGDIYIVEESFMKNTAPHVLQVHGHRNPKLAPIETSNRTFNLCDEVEFGGDFRVLTITKDKIEPEYYPNPIYTKRNEKSDIFQKLDDSNLIKKKQCSDGIVSYNFNADAFYNKHWNTLTCTARGLFVKDKKVVARGYNKFFNIGERPETQLSTLCKTLKFPVMSYFKYNGFLGLVSVIDDEVRIFTKSQDFGEYVDYFKNILFSNLDKDKIKAVMKEYGLTNHTLIFECIDPINDPHIIEYDAPQLVLLDIVENNLDNKFIEYSVVFNIACALKIACKIPHAICRNPIEFNSYVKQWSTKPDSDFEGFVLEDADGTRVKLKTNFYLTWKRLRGDLFKLKKNPDYTIEENRSSFEKDIFEEMKKLPKEELAKIDNVISLRRLLQDKKVNMNMLE